ncbi:hypothetical protein [Sphingomonas sp.]|jgi:hypothetical protein|uniref:hypothetical protein n=1 Tax=Sphingomonas sp. TaxID=28214 RepID=UPI003569971B
MSVPAEQMQQPMPQDVAPTAQDEMQPDTGGQGDEDSQQAYEAVCAVIDTMLFKDQKTSDAVMKSLSEPYPNSIAQASAQIVQTIDERLDNKLPDDVIIPAASYAAEQIGQMAEAAGLVKIDEEFVKQTLGFTMAEAGKLYGVGPDEMQAQAQEASGQLPTEETGEPPQDESMEPMQEEMMPAKGLASAAAPQGAPYGS